jgi:hypothetical protein
MVLVTSPDIEVYQVKPAGTQHIYAKSSKSELGTCICTRPAVQAQPCLRCCSLSGLIVVVFKTLWLLLLNLLMTICVPLLPHGRRCGSGAVTLGGTWIPGAGRSWPSATRASFLGSHLGKFKPNTTSEATQLFCDLRASTSTCSVKVAHVAQWLLLSSSRLACSCCF